MHGHIQTFPGLPLLVGQSKAFMMAQKAPKICWLPLFQPPFMHSHPRPSCSFSKELALLYIRVFAPTVPSACNALPPHIHPQHTFACTNSYSFFWPQPKCHFLKEAPPLNLDPQAKSGPMFVAHSPSSLPS